MKNYLYKNVLSNAMHGPLNLHVDAGHTPWDRAVVDVQSYFQTSFSFLGRIGQFKEGY